jgi:hypothetical protein
MRLIEAFEIVTDCVENDIKYSKEINNDFNDEFLNEVINFLENRCDVLNRAEQRERKWNQRRNLEK